MTQPSEPETVRIDTGGEVDELGYDDDYGRGLWWFWIVIALGLIAFGLIFFAWPRETVLVLAVTAGIALVIFGALEAVASCFQRDDDLWVWFLFRGIVTFGLGVALLVWPGKTILIIAVIFGIYLIFVGLTEIILAIVVDDNDSRWLYILLGVVGVVLGILVITEIRNSHVIGYFIGAFVIFFGAVNLISALAMREDAIDYDDIDPI